MTVRVSGGTVGSDVFTVDRTVLPTDRVIRSTDPIGRVNGRSDRVIRSVVSSGWTAFASALTSERTKNAEAPLSSFAMVVSSSCLVIVEFINESTVGDGSLRVGLITEDIHLVEMRVTDIRISRNNGS